MTIPEKRNYKNSSLNCSLGLTNLIDCVKKKEKKDNTIKIYKYLTAFLMLTKPSEGEWERESDVET